MSHFSFSFLSFCCCFVRVFFLYKSWSNFFSLSLKYGVPFIWSIRFCNFCAVRYNPNNLVQTQHSTHSWSACTLSLSVRMLVVFMFILVCWFRCECDICEMQWNLCYMKSELNIAYLNQFLEKTDECSNRIIRLQCNDKRKSKYTFYCSVFHLFCGKNEGFSAELMLKAIRTISTNFT